MARKPLTPEQKIRKAEREKYRRLVKACEEKCPYCRSEWCFMGDTEPTLICYKKWNTEFRTNYCNPTQECKQYFGEEFIMKKEPSRYQGCWEWYGLGNGHF